MAYEIPGRSTTLQSAADYRTGNGQYRFVKVNAAGKGQQTVAGEAIYGVRQNTPNLNEGMTVVSSGISMIETGGAFAAGDPLASDATGRAVKAVTGNVIVGTAMEANASAGILGTISLADGSQAKL